MEIGHEHLALGPLGGSLGLPSDPRQRMAEEEVPPAKSRHRGMVPATGWLGLGGLVLRDVAGASVLTSTKVYGSVAYHPMLGTGSLQRQAPFDTQGGPPARAVPQLRQPLAGADSQGK